MVTLLFRGDVARKVPLFLLLAAVFAAFTGMRGPPPTAVGQPQLPSHYACHVAPGMNVGAIVGLETQFGVEEAVEVRPDSGYYLCPPALKNGQGDLSAPHLRCYSISKPAPNRLVDLQTQFGELRNVVVGEATSLCAPASKVPYPEPAPPPPEKPHYKCYNITGEPVNQTVLVQTQFYPEGLPVEVLEPSKLCLPAGKNGSPIPDAPHLVCYHTSLPWAGGLYNVQTQFLEMQPLEPWWGDLLCVPAEKEVVTPPEPESPSFSLAMGAVTAPPDAVLALSPVVGGPPVVVIPGIGLGLGFVGPDDLNSLSYGMEYPASTTQFLRFSVAPDNVAPPDGLPWSHVFAESSCIAWPGQAIGDEFDAPMPPPPPGIGNTNTQVLDENGVQDNPACAFPSGYPLGTGPLPGDDLDALENRPPSFVDADGNGLPERPVFFTLAPGSATLGLIGATPADILTSTGGAQPSVYAPGWMLGLNQMPPFADAIDALMLWDNGDLAFGRGDWAWLSLTPGSPTLGLLGATEGDVLFVDGATPGVISVQYTADQLGLASGLMPVPWSPDDVDALKGEIPCLTGPDSDIAIGNGSAIPGDDRTVPAGEFPPMIDCAEGDDDNDGYPDNLELVLPDPSCPTKTGLTSPGGDITYDDNGDGDPCSGSLGGTDPADDPASWDTDGDAVLDGAECALGTDPANAASNPTPAQCGGTGDADGDGLLNSWETCKWGTNPAVVDTDGDGMGDCREAADVDGNGAVTFTGDVIFYARAYFVGGKDGDFDIDGNNRITYVGDVLTEARFALMVGLCW